MYWPLFNMYSEILDLGQEVFVIRGTFIKLKEGLVGFRVQVRFSETCAKYRSVLAACVFAFRRAFLRMFCQQNARNYVSVLEACHGATIHRYPPGNVRFLEASDMKEKNSVAS